MSRNQWIPLEANEDILNIYLSKTGVGAGQLAFHEIFGFDALEFVPRPVKAVLVCFPICDAQEQHAAEEAQRIAAQGQICSPSVFYMKQTIGNACGTIGMLHAIGNLRPAINPGSYLEGFFANVKGKNPEEIGAYLEGDTTLEAVHEDAAAGGQSEIPDDLENITLHFICFCMQDGCLYELDGRKRHPINHGPTSDGTLLEDAVNVVKDFMKRDPDNINYTMVALSASE